MVKPALGRGLGALLSGVPTVSKAAASSPESLADPGEAVVASQSVRSISLKQIRPCPFQPRKEFSEESLRELADSIQQQGVVQPLLVRQRGDHFELIAGERRWRAAQLLGLTEIPVLVREADDRTVLELALIENLQRENLNPLEEALGFSELLDQFQMTQEEVATRVGKSRAAVANALRLLKLPPSVQESIRSGRLSAGHAKVVLSLADPGDQQKAANRIVAEALNVRQTEQLVARWESSSTPAAARSESAPKPLPDAHLGQIEDQLKQRLATKVSLRYREGKGSIEVRFFSDAELNRLLEILGVRLD
jgi:ParB family chromosome partitioning protein